MPAAALPASSPAAVAVKTPRPFRNEYPITCMSRTPLIESALPPSVDSPAPIPRRSDTPQKILRSRQLGGLSYDALHPQSLPAAMQKSGCKEERANGELPAQCHPDSRKP